MNQLPQPLQLQNLPTQPDSYNLYLSAPGWESKPAAVITKEGVFRVHVDPSDENAKKFVELVNNALQGKAAPLTAMELINGE